MALFREKSCLLRFVSVTGALQEAERTVSGLDGIHATTGSPLGRSAEK